MATSDANRTRLICAASGNMEYAGVNASLGKYGTSIYSQFDVAVFSDARRKTDIQLISNALDKLDGIHGYTFAYTNTITMQTPFKRSAGVLAQEVLEVLPEVVDTDPDGFLNVRYGNMIALLIQAVKELNAKVSRLEAKA